MPRKSPSSQPFNDFRHPEAKRPNNPPAGIAPTYESPDRQTRQYAYDPHLDPQLVWAGKAGHTSFEVEGVSSYIHERDAEGNVGDQDHT
jgi:adenine-specific DNA-methyltransferase